MIEMLFWLLLGILIYTFFGYPLLCFVLGRFRNRPVRWDESYQPAVTLVISAYNEETVIGKKIDNTMELDYPRERLEVIVASDGSTDRTNEIVREKIAMGEYVKLLAFQENRGKTTVQNDAVMEARGEIVVFSDANAMYQQDALGKLVRNFADREVGCVCGELVYLAGESAASQGEGFYWRYEQFLKKAESRLGSVLGATGAIYAVRKDLYVPLDVEIISDFVEPLRIVEGGHRAVYEEEAVAYEQIDDDYGSGWKRKIRIIARGYQGLLSVKHLMNPFRYGFLALGLISHRLLRWYAGFLLPGVLGFNAYLAWAGPALYLWLLLIHVCFYFLAAAGMISGVKWKPLMVPAYFCAMNLASVLGVVQYYRGRRYVSWEPVR